MLFSFLLLLVPISLANKSSEHINSKEKSFNAQFHPKKFKALAGFNLNKILEKKSKEIVCPEFDTNTFTEIADGTEISGNSYACNHRFKNPISITGHLLQIYHCRFSKFKDSIPISINSVSSEGSIIISNCDFYENEGSIYLDQVNPKELKITYCQFAHCISISNKCVIQFNSNSGTIEHCYFRENSYYIMSQADIHYKPSSTENRLTIDNCIFEQALSSSSSNFLQLEDNSKITFTNNFINIWKSGSKVFKKEIKNLTDHIFENNNMYPFDKNNIGTSNLPEGTFGDAPDMECPDLPEGVISTPDNYYCGNIGDPSDTTIVKANSFVQIYYSSFNTNKNVNGNGGAVFLSIPNQPKIDTRYSVKIYHSVFFGCYAKNGCAIYLESSDKDRLFDFYQCSFDYEADPYLAYPQAGGAVYIKSSVSCFKFTDCVFSKNVALDGGAIYYLSDGSSDADVKKFALEVTNCNFYQNTLYNAGGAICIYIKNNGSPRPIDINRCNFVENWVSGDDDKYRDKPELGGAIYYSYDSQSSSSSSEGTDYSFRVFDCIFIGNCCNSYGGSICLSIAKNELYKPIEIAKCSFDDNFASNVYGEKDYDGHGGAICYILKDTPQPSGSSNPSLNIQDCNFTNNYAYCEGGSIDLLIQKAQSSRSIEIVNCIFDDNEKVKKLDSPATPNGAFISYLIDSNNNPPLHITGCNFLGINDRFYDGYNIEERGGCIYISVTNSEQTGTIEINNCYFCHSKSSSEHSYGGSIYYTSSTASQSASVSTVLSISNCEFSESKVNENGGSIYILFTDDESQKQIEINNCTFKQTTSDNNKDAIYIKSNKKTNNVKFTDSTFESCMILFSAISTSIENCRFNNIEQGNHAIFYSNSDNIEDLEASLKIDNCNFTQTSSVVNSLVYFDTQLSSKFCFTNNNITFTDETSHVLDCKQDITIKGKDFWEFSNNDLEPNEEVVIKTTNAKDIPAFCVKGFSCPAPPKNCEGNNRCDIDIIEKPEDLPQELNGREYYNLNTTGTNKIHGGAIRLIDYALDIKNSLFTLCKAEQGGGGGIYIVVKSPIGTKLFNIEKNTFEKCEAKFGGAIYIYSYQEDCSFQIVKCKFMENAAAESPDKEGSVLFDGAAIYLQTQKTQVLRCSFRKNVGCSVKIYNKEILDPPSEDSSSKSLKLNSKFEPAIEISHCLFEADKSTSSSSLFYVRESNKNQRIGVKVSECIFSGEVRDGSHHIDGKVRSNEGNVLNIKFENCKFSSDRMKAVNPKLQVIDLKSQQFNYNENADNENKLHYQDKTGVNLILISVSALVAVSLVVIIIIKKKNSQNQVTGNDTESIEENENEL